MADNTTEIAQLRAVLNGTATAVTVDGQTVHYSLTSARRRLRELIATDDTETNNRPKSSTINLSGF